MNLYLRLLWLLLRLPWMKKQSDPLASSTLSMRVMPFDLDVFMHVNNGRYLSMMDLGRLHLMWVIGLLKPLRQQRWNPLLGSVKIHYLKPLTLFQHFTLNTQTLYWDEKWIYVEQKIYHRDQLCAVALMKILFIGKEGKIAPQSLLDLLPHPPKQPPIPDVIKYWMQAEQASRP